MPTALFNRNRGRKPATSTAGYSTIRRAGGGSSLMARTGRDRFLRERRPPVAHGGDDRISALSDDLLLLVLRRLDTREALGTGMLSTRWACLPRELPDLDFRVGDILPPRYHRCVLLHRDTEVTDLQYQVSTKRADKVRPHIRRYERRAMRALTSSVESFLDADVGRSRSRRVNRLRLEFFATHNTGCINRLVARAIDAWEVNDLVAVAKPIYSHCRNFHTFPNQGICEEPRASRLRTLRLGGCALPPLHEHSALTVLVLQDTPRSTPASAYEGIFTSCPQLQVLHLICCRCSGIGDIMVDAPNSDMKELVVDKCEFGRICLKALPKLESLASLGTRVRFESSSFPCLRQYNLSLWIGFRLESACEYFAPRIMLKLSSLLGCTLDITDLIVRFTGPDRWIEPSISSSPSLLPNLRRLLIADVPWSWDVSWPRLLLETAPSLETLHIHISPPSKEEEDEPRDDEIPWQPTLFVHHNLKEFVIVGFEGTDRQVYLVRFVMGVCSTALRHVAMHKKGHAQDKGHWDWEMMTQQHSQWTDEEKDKTLKLIMNGFPSSSAVSPVIVLG